MLAGGMRPGAEKLEFFSMRLKRWHGSSGEASGSWRGGGGAWSGVGGVLQEFLEVCLCGLLHSFPFH